MAYVGKCTSCGVDTVMCCGTISPPKDMYCKNCCLHPFDEPEKETREIVERAFGTSEVWKALDEAVSNVLHAYIPCSYDELTQDDKRKFDTIRFSAQSYAHAGIREKLEALNQLTHSEENTKCS